MARFENAFVVVIQPRVAETISNPLFESFLDNGEARALKTLDTFSSCHRPSGRRDIAGEYSVRDRFAVDENAVTIEDDEGHIRVPELQSNVE